MGKRSTPRWIRWPLEIGAWFFIFCLVLSAVFDPTIRVLHALQALIYLAVIFLARRNSAWGFGAGFFIAIFWNYTNLFVTTFIKAGWEQLNALIRTSHLARPDLLIAVFAAFGHFLMIAACLAGFLHTRPKAREWKRFFAGGVLTIAYFVLIIYTTGPQYIGLVHRIFHL